MQAATGIDLLVQTRVPTTTTIPVPTKTEQPDLCFQKEPHKEIQ